MSDILSGLYPWTRALHIIAVIAWMAGMLYLPRLYVYHAGVPQGSDQSALFKIMERRLLRAIINPAMIATFVLGILLLLTPGVADWSAGWLHAKILVVVLLAGFHGALARWRKDFERDANRRSAAFYRIMNEVPTVLMVIAVILAVVRPF